MTRENWSRPSASTPNQWSADGPGQHPSLRRLRSCSRGSYGAMSGAKIAVSTKAATRANPTIAPGLRTSRRQASLQRPLGLSSSTSLASSCATDTSAHPDPRVDERVRDVDEEVHEHEDDGDEEDAALEHRIVAGLDGTCEPAPHSWDRKHRLGEDRAREQQPGLQADDRDDRQHRVPEDV